MLNILLFVDGRVPDSLSSFSTSVNQIKNVTIDRNNNEKKLRRLSIVSIFITGDNKKKTQNVCFGSRTPLNNPGG